MRWRRRPTGIAPPAGFPRQRRARRGEQIVASGDSRPPVKMVPAHGAAGMDFVKAALVRRALGIDDLTVELPAGGALLTVQPTTALVLYFGF